MNFKGPSVPSNKLLSDWASPEVWSRVKKQAARAPMIRFKVGCVLWDPSSEIIVATGCSNPDIRFSKAAASMHAERHALRRVNKYPTNGLWAFVFTYGRSGGCAWTSRPCSSCATALYRASVERVVFPERTESGEWQVISESVEALTARSTKASGVYARRQRIASLA